MKKVGIWNNYTFFSKNRLFNSNAYEIGCDLGMPYIQLKEEFKKKGYILETLDMSNPKNYEKVIFLDVPDEKNLPCQLDEIDYEKRYLVITECEMIYSPNKNRKLLEKYKKVFTYNDKCVRENKYIKVCLPNKMKSVRENIKFSNKIFCTMISGNKTSKMQGELYSKRLEWIEYMEKNHPDEFHLYGTGWNKRFYGGKLQRLNHIEFLQKIFTKKHICYRGTVDDKLGVMEKYKFCITYENTDNIEGYISEKIWDAFFAGTVPIYLGAPNVLKYIPENCFIDRRKFDTDEELYYYLKKISKEQYEEFLNNIKIFLDSHLAYPFSSEAFTAKIIEEVLG